MLPKKLVLLKKRSENLILSFVTVYCLKMNIRLRVPPGKSEVLLANLDNIPVTYPPQPAYVYHRIRPGESLSTIARRYRSSVRKIMRANNLHRSSYIVAGRKLKIPQRGIMPYRPETDPNKDCYATTHPCCKKRRFTLEHCQTI